MLVVGVTGGVSSGKTAVCRMFSQWGAIAFDSDAVVHERLRRGTSEFRRIVNRFGRTILDEKGRIDRAELRFMALRRGGLRFLEQVLHPAVRRRMRSEVSSLKGKEGVYVAEVPLLFETGFDRMMDRTIAVVVSRSIWMRLARKKKMCQSDLESYSKRQWPQVRKARKADWVIRNDGTLVDLRRKARKIFRHVLQAEHDNKRRR